MMKLSIAIYVVVRNNSLPVLLLGTPNMIKFEGHKCKGHRINTWWTHILNVDIGIIIILVEVFPCSTHTQYTCDLVKWKLSPVASFSILLRMTIYYNYLIMSSKWVLFSSLFIWAVDEKESCCLWNSKESLGKKLIEKAQV